MKALLDTNIILDVFLSREPNIDSANKIFKLISKDKIEAYASASSITDIYYVTAKRLGTNGRSRDASPNPSAE